MQKTNEQYTKMKENFDKIKKIKKELIYNYDYSYYDTNVAGSKDGAIVPNESLNEKFGPSRRGYEMFKTEFSELRVGYSGVTSIREISLRDSNEVVGYIMESKKPERPYIQEAKNLYDDMYAEFVELMDVKDENALEYYIEDNGPGYDLYEKDSVALDQRKAEFLMELIDLYKYDEDFKHYFDKIIG